MVKDKTKNQINVIYPYRTKAGWSFDDAEVELHGEPFIAGLPEIIDSVAGEVDNFTAYISKDPIPDYTILLNRMDDKNEIGWYEMEGTELVGWLCPATLKYFENYPKQIYVKIEK